MLGLQPSSITDLKAVFIDFAQSLSEQLAVPDHHDCLQSLCHLQGSLLFLILPGNTLCVVWLVGCMPELITSRSAAADVHGDAPVDRDEGGPDVDCEEVLDGAQSRLEPVLGIWFLL